MNVSALISKVRRLADENSPVILTGMAVSGAFLSAYFTYKGTRKSMIEIRETNDQIERASTTADDLSFLEELNLTWKNYIPAVSALGGTTACMIMATKIGLDRTAAMAGALVVTERTYDQYKEKVKETLGEAKHTKVVDAVATDRVNATPVNNLVIVGEGEQLCFDEWSGRYFKSSMEKILQAKNDFNHELLFGGPSSLSSFYSLVGLEPTQGSDDIGWMPEHLLELTVTSILKDNKACIAFQMDPMPTARFQNKHG